jgi:hypothetical protein
MPLVYKNSGSKDVPVRDDAGKRIVAPGESFVLTGDQHAPMVEALGLEAVTVEPVAADASFDELTETARNLGVKPASRRKDDVRAAVVAVTGEEPAGEPV